MIFSTVWLMTKVNFGVIESCNAWKPIKHLVQVCCGNKIHNITDTGYRFWLVTLETIKWRLKGIWFWKNIWFWKKRIDSDHWSIKEQAGNPLLSQGSRVWKDSDACLSALKGSLFPCKIIQIVEKFHEYIASSVGPQPDSLLFHQSCSGLVSAGEKFCLVPEFHHSILFLQHFCSSPQVGVFSPKKNHTYTFLQLSYPLHFEACSYNFQHFTPFGAV